nr:protease inhibitor I42 family protein [Amycolatopsis sp. CA-230715]
MRVGDTVELSLPEVPSSGFRWLCRLPRGVHLVDDEYRGQDGGEQGHPIRGQVVTGAGPPGAGGVRRLAFGIVDAGRLPLHADLIRPWEQAPRRTLTFVLSAAPNE